VVLRELEPQIADPILVVVGEERWSSAMKAVAGPRIHRVRAAEAVVMIPWIPKLHDQVLGFDALPRKLLSASRSLLSLATQRHRDALGQTAPTQTAVGASLT
jgi:hypothetical protein